jgi:hypothetical protein
MCIRARVEVKSKFNTVDFCGGPENIPCLFIIHDTLDIMGESYKSKYNKNRVKKVVNIICRYSRPMYA